MRNPDDPLEERQTSAALRRGLLYSLAAVVVLVLVLLSWPRTGGVGRMTPERAQNVYVKGPLRNLVSLQEIFFADNNRYAVLAELDTAGLHHLPGSTFAADTFSASDGTARWAGWVDHPDTEGRPCAISEGAEALQPGSPARERLARSWPPGLLELLAASPPTELVCVQP